MKNFTNILQINQYFTKDFTNNTKGLQKYKRIKNIDIDIDIDIQENFVRILRTKIFWKRASLSSTRENGRGKKRKRTRL